MTEATDVHLSIVKHGFGETPIADLMAICVLAAPQKPSTVFEFGTFTGHTTLNLAMNTGDARIITLDLPPDTREDMSELDWDRKVNHSVIGSWFRESQYRERIEQVFADSRKLDTAPYAGKMDFVFVDACHEYEFMVSDISKAFEMVAKGGIVVWYDYSRAFPNVYRHITELTAAREIYWVEGTQVVFCRA